MENSIPIVFYYTFNKLLTNVYQIWHIALVMNV